jgi:phenylalanyl-tRNA synthetase beta chain
VALAGIMGGEETEVAETTTNVLLEAANFEPVGILRSSERLGLRTEGSNRWEKGVDRHPAPQAVHDAARRRDVGSLMDWHADVGRPTRAACGHPGPERTDEVLGEDCAGRSTPSVSDLASTWQTTGR